MLKTADLHIVATRPLLSPSLLLEEFPLPEDSAALVAATRERIRAIISGKDRRLLAVVGPCSIHDPEAAIDYAHRLSRLRSAFADRIEVVMRVYFEKPRTTTGWKGLINDPHLDGSFDINTGLRRARRLLVDLARLGMPAATELLDPIIPQYLADAISWTAIGARTTESQTHREMASGLSMPVGFKNGTDGSISTAINAMLTAAGRHHFLGVDRDGRAAIVATTGNPDCHLVLRGGKNGPNYEQAQVAKAAAELTKAGVGAAMMVDCSHDNCAKDHERQAIVCAAVAEQVRAGSRSLLGVMIESHLVAGKQSINPDRSAMTYGQSITDACVDVSATERMLAHLHAAVSV